MTTNNSQQRTIAIISVILVLLLGVSIFLLINNYNKGKALEQTAMELNESNELVDSLENQFNQAILELDAMKGTNAELNAVIEQQKAELTDQKSKIKGMIRDQRNLKKAREEIANLKSQMEGYVSQIDQLRSENEELANTNEVLNQDLSQQRMQNEELTTAKAALVSEKQMLETEKSSLTEKVTFASVVKVNSLEVTGFKEKDNGKLRKRRYAKNIDQIQICFNMLPNKLAGEGVEEFFVRIISPVGETISPENKTLKDKDSGTEKLYTQKIERPYSAQEENVCIDWADPTGFQKGNYEVELYNKGYLSGKTNFQLK